MRHRDGSGGLGRGAVRVLRGKRLLGSGKGTAPAGDARPQGGNGCAVWFGLCSPYERLLPVLRDDAALGRRGVGATAPLAWMGRGVAHAASGWSGAVWAAGLCGCCGESAASGRARHGAGGRCAAARREGMRGSVWLVQVVRAPPPGRARRCGPRAARRWSDGAISVDGEGRCACGIGMVQAVWAAGLCRVLRGKRRLGLG